jgi:iron complex outermembrane receptor protein
MTSEVGERLRKASWLVIALSLSAASTAAAEAARVFRLPVDEVNRSIVRFGIQAGVSVGGFPAPGCAGLSHPVAGILTPSAALRRLLPANCSFERLDPRAYLIVAAAPRRVEAPTPVFSARPADVAELVVTAEKRQEPLRGSPFAVSAFNGPEIERLGARSFNEVALQFPGVSETNLGPGRNKIFVRGISDGAFTGRTQSTVGLYLDEVPITYNAPDPDLRLVDIDRVEVLRGPQGTLYGSGSIGGIVRIVAMRPDPRRMAGNLLVEGMTNQHGDQSGGAEAVINVPLWKQRAAVRAVAYIDELSGYLDNPGLGQKDVNRGHRSGQRLAGLVDNGEGWRAQASIVRQSIKTDDSQYTQGRERLSRSASIREPHDNDFILFGGSVSHEAASTAVRLSAAYIDHDLSTRYDATGAFDLPSGGVAAFDEHQQVELWVAEAVANSVSPGRFRWLAGAFGSISRETSGGVLDATISSGGVRSVFRRRDELSEAAVFGELTYELSSRLTATLGGRLFATRVGTVADRFGLAPGMSGLRDHLTDEGFTPKARLSYAYSPDLVVYAQVQDGYRAGGFNVPAAADGMPGGPTVGSFRPDRLRSYEIGGEMVLFSSALTVRGAVFRADWRNVQTDQFRPSGLPLTLNIGDGSNTAVEFEGLWQPDRHWRLRLNGLVGEPQLTRTSDLFPARVDIGLPGVAKQTFTADLAYALDLPLDLRAEVSAQVAYVGRSFLTFDGATASAMGNYAQGRLAFRVMGRRWEAQAYVNNVGDESGNTFAYGNPFSRARSRQVTPLPPRTFGLALRRSL